jgi:hypothetical protein
MNTGKPLHQISPLSLKNKHKSLQQLIARIKGGVLGGISLAVYSGLFTWTNLLRGADPLLVEREGEGDACCQIWTSVLVNFYGRFLPHKSGGAAMLRADF